MDWLLRLLNLDGVVGESQPRAKKSPKTKSKPQAADSAPASTWVAAGEEVERAQTVESLPWQTERTTGRAWYWRLLRGALVAAAIVVLLVGLRTMFFPVKTEQTAAPVDAAAQFPTTDAAGVAERFTTSYLTWDQDAPEARSAALALDVPSLSESERFGWDGTGWQTATDAHTITVVATDEETATATVVVQLATKIDDANTTTRWAALAVPVAVSDGRVIVTGQPASVAVPTPTPIGVDETAAPVMEDSEIARSTKTYAESFFTAFGRDDDVSSLTAPGAGVAGLGGLYELSTLKTWSVYEGSGNTRSARAVVQWTDAAGSTIEQTYWLTLAKVSGGDSTRWQVASIDGSNH